MQQENETKSKHRSLGSRKIALILLVVAIVPMALTYWPVGWQEVRYLLSVKPKDAVITGFGASSTAETTLSRKGNAFRQPEITPVDTEFGVVIPKIGANSKVVEGVDPFVSAQYQVALTKGVAHAKNTATPDKQGNVFLFAHSSDNFLNANIYNSVFYLLHRIQNGDYFYLIYKGVKYRYNVVEKSIVTPDSLEYMKNFDDRSTATLMTCWPPGTTFNRLVVVGELVK